MYQSQSYRSIVRPLRSACLLRILKPARSNLDIYGLTKLLHWPVLIGTPIVVMPKFDLRGLCELVQKYKVTILMLVPPIALALARDPTATKDDLSSLRLVISGAAPLGPELEKELANRLPKCDVIQAYGPSCSLL